jgi:PglZ domain
LTNGALGLTAAASSSGLSTTSAPTTHSKPPSASPNSNNEKAIGETFGRWELEAAIRLTELKQQCQIDSAQSAEQLFEAYANHLHKFDTAYRHFMVATDRAKPILRERGLIQHIEKLYTNSFLQTLGQHWSDSLISIPTWPIPNIPHQPDFFQTHVQPIIDRNDRENVTRLGMASLLPGSTIDFLPGAADVLRNHKSTQGREAREATLQANSNSPAIAIPAADILTWTIEQGREAIKPHRIIYIYHDVIDTIGDKAASERQVLEACDKAIQEILKLTKRLCNSLNATRIIRERLHFCVSQSENPARNDLIFHLHKILITLVTPGQIRNLTGIMAMNCCKISFVSLGKNSVKSFMELTFATTPILSYQNLHQKWT